MCEVHMMIVHWVFLHCVVFCFVCYEVSEDYTAFVLRVTEEHCVSVV